jgi:hypothetical protein
MPDSPPVRSWKISFRSSRLTSTPTCLFFLDNTTGDAFHSCVHLADNIVYTKNGRNILSPWVIMRLEDVKKVYLYKGNGRVQGFRRKDIAAEKAAQAGE